MWTFLPSTDFPPSPLLKFALTGPCLLKSGFYWSMRLPYCTTAIVAPSVEARQALPSRIEINVDKEKISPALSQFIISTDLTPVPMANTAS